MKIFVSTGSASGEFKVIGNPAKANLSLDEERFVKKIKPKENPDNRQEQKDVAVAYEFKKGKEALLSLDNIVSFALVRDLGGEYTRLIVLERNGRDYKVALSLSEENDDPDKPVQVLGAIVKNNIEVLPPRQRNLPIFVKEPAIAQAKIFLPTSEVDELLSDLLHCFSKPDDRISRLMWTNERLEKIAHINFEKIDPIIIRIIGQSITKIENTNWRATNYLQANKTFTKALSDQSMKVGFADSITEKILDLPDEELSGVLLDLVLNKQILSREFEPEDLTYLEEIDLSKYFSPDEIKMLLWICCRSTNYEKPTVTHLLKNPKMQITQSKYLPLNSKEDESKQEARKAQGTEEIRLVKAARRTEEARRAKEVRLAEIARRAEEARYAETARHTEEERRCIEKTKHIEEKMRTEIARRTEAGHSEDEKRYQESLAILRAKGQIL